MGASRFEERHSGPARSDNSTVTRKAIYALTGAKDFDPQGQPDAFNEWIKTLQKALTEQLGGLIISYEKALAENPLTKGNDYPPHLRSTAASIFNWGRVVSMTAPLITAPLAEHFGLAPVMCLASVSFLVAAAIWFSLPETVDRRTALN